MEGPAAQGRGRRDRDRAGVRRSLGELRVPRREERAGPARGAHHAAAPQAPARRHRRAHLDGHRRRRLDRGDPGRAGREDGGRDLERRRRLARLAARQRAHGCGGRRRRRRAGAAWLVAGDRRLDPRRLERHPTDPDPDPRAHGALIAYEPCVRTRRRSHRACGSEPRTTVDVSQTSGGTSGLPGTARRSSRTPSRATSAHSRRLTRAGATCSPGRRSAVERREQVDGVAVGVEHLGVALPPEGVPGIALRLEPGSDDRGMRLVDACRRAAVERKPERVADGLLPAAGRAA